MLYKKIENRDFNKKISIEYIGYVFTPLRQPYSVGFVKATVEDVKKEYDSMFELQLKEESNLVWDKKKRKWKLKK